ncbi:P-II family nitrogen regulator [Micrococcus sp. HG099]|uniref:Nitrogen regulatory protein P-II 1/nitrogen regulatory protein P-II 2 n=1 Tax=Micrococcus endophyticus TaxID=455343 RepID=A0A4Y8ZLC9_9MICC|nr:MULTISPECIES: P-II family nitrogen regulator [Micrococcus]MBB5848824.1 nitrogen regulatory protein P-II 1/nitrogen regulatory protein P-II 2 [Micrococcus endophyticus]MCR8675461.1 P-II family nitrogen regulator [Micrococcus sp. HG099]TFI50376.1 P-II family nitrogen regulator [Micrococcus endophyticus]
MKLITAVIRPSRLKKVGNALEAAGLTGLTATEVQGRGAQGGRTEYYRGEAHDVVFRTKVRLEMVVADEQLEDAIDVLVAAARSDDEGTIGDGKVWVTDVVRVVRVRTGETGPEAV